jgi:hypothetical protein
MSDPRGATAAPASATTEPRSATAEETGGRARRRRWHRAVIPFAVAAALIVISGVSHAIEQPDLGEPGTLSPTGTGPDGSSRLAALLAERGVTVERHTRSVDAVRSALRGGATIFVPAPDFPNPNLARLLAALPVDNRLVLVAPSWRDQHNLPVVPFQSRWAPTAPAPGCAEPAPQEAGRATAVYRRYVALPFLTKPYRCYDGGLVGGRWAHLDLVVVGASDPFRNSRIGEHGNARLATGLLGAHERLIWLDLHAPEPVSYSVLESDRLGIDLPDAEEGGQARADGPPNPLWSAVPSGFWPILVQLALVAVLLALWRGRRLGPPVPEPLPVVVPAAETVTGRGRLYARAGARGAALDALRAAARHRILPLLDLPPGAAEADVVAAVAARTGMPAAQVSMILHGPEPTDDAELMTAVAALDSLVSQLTRETRRTGR